MAKISPCKGCADRGLGCHGICRQYKEWKKEDLAEKQWVKEQNGGITEHQRESIHAMMRRKTRGILRLKGGRDI